VPGPKLLDSPYEKDALTQDFLMINFPVFFNRNPQEYENFIRYQADGSKFGYFFQGRNPLDWKWREVVLGGRLLGRITNPLYAQYFSDRLRDGRKPMPEILPYGNEIQRTSCTLPRRPARGVTTTCAGAWRPPARRTAAVSRCSCRTRRATCRSRTHVWPSRRRPVPWPASHPAQVRHLTQRILREPAFTPGTVVDHRPLGG
jgi:hypothetical protein